MVSLKTGDIFVVQISPDMKQNGFAMWECDPTVYSAALEQNTLGKEKTFKVHSGCFALGVSRKYWCHLLTLEHEKTAKLNIQ